MAISVSFSDQPGHIGSAIVGVGDRAVAGVLLNYQDYVRGTRYLGRSLCKAKNRQESYQAKWIFCCKGE
jgi:hypothetical protein